MATQARETVLLVRNPRTVEEGPVSRYTEYEIYLHTTNIAFDKTESAGVRRRFREFVWLRKTLLSSIVISDLPPLPPKAIFGRFSEEFIEARREALQEFLRSLLSIPEVLTETSFHLFLQTNFKTEDIEKMIEEPAHRYPLPGFDGAASPEVLIISNIRKTHSDSRAASMSSGSVSVSASEGEPCYKTADLPRGAMAKHVAHIPDDLHSASPMTQFVSTPSPSRGYSRSLGTLGDMNVVSFKK